MIRVAYRYFFLFALISWTILTSQAVMAQNPMFMTEEELRQKRLGLEQKLQEATSAEDKIRYSIELAKLLAREDFQAAEKMALQAIDAALAEEDNLIKGRAYFQLGYMYAQADRQIDALKAYQSAYPFVEDQGEDMLFASLNAETGRLYGLMGNLEKAVDYVLLSVQTLEAMDSDMRRDRYLCGLLNMLADLLAQNGQEERAISYARKSITLAMAIENWNLVSSTWTNIGHYSKKSGNSEAAEFAYSKAMEYRELAQKKRAAPTTRQQKQR